MSSGPLFRSHIHSFARVLPLLRGAKVLDLGCAAGNYLRHFGPGSVGLELSPADLAKCREQGLEVREADLDDTLPVHEGEFDAVFCSNVLEHVSSPIHLLREARRSLREGGRVVLALPIEGSLSDLMRRNRYFENHDGHIYAFSPRNTKRLLAAADFAVESHHVEPWPAELLNRLHLLRLADGLLQILPLVLAQRFGDNYWTVARAVAAEPTSNRSVTDGDRLRSCASTGVSLV